MWPHSLLFSSDEEASRTLNRAFRDLEFEVETCPEIFGAVEKITRRSFDVVVSDWNEGLEAVFLLKTVRELKANHSAFTIAIASAEAAVAAREAGADLVLSRPLVADQVKYAVLTCDAFLAQMKSWLPRLSVSPVEPAMPKPPFDRQGELSKGTRASVNVLNPAPRLRAWPSPPPPRRTENVSPVVAAETIFDHDLLHPSQAQTLLPGARTQFFVGAYFAQKTSQPGVARSGDCRRLSFRRVCIYPTFAGTRNDVLGCQDMRAHVGADPSLAAPSR